MKKKRNPITKDLRTPKYRLRVTPKNKKKKKVEEIKKKEADLHQYNRALEELRHLKSTLDKSEEQVYYIYAAVTEAVEPLFRLNNTISKTRLRIERALETLKELGIHNNGNVQLSQGPEPV